MSWEVRAPHLEPGAVGPGAEEEGSLHGPHQDDDVAPAHLDLLGRRHGDSLSEGELPLRGPTPLVAQQPPFHLEPAAVSAERSVRGDHTVARHDQRDRVPAVGGAHRPGGGRSSDGPRQLSVGPGGAGGDGAQRGPDLALEPGALRVDLQRIDRAEVAAEVGGERGGDFPCRSRIRRRCAFFARGRGELRHPAAEEQRARTDRAGGEGDGSQRRINSRQLDHGSAPTGRRRRTRGAWRRRRATGARRPIVAPARRRTARARPCAGRGLPRGTRPPRRRRAWRDSARSRGRPRAANASDRSGRPGTRAAPGAPGPSAPRTGCSRRAPGSARCAPAVPKRAAPAWRSEEHTSELQSRSDLVCRLLLEKKKKKKISIINYKKKKTKNKKSNL